MQKFKRSLFCALLAGGIGMSTFAQNEFVPAADQNKPRDGSSATPVDLVEDPCEILQAGGRVLSVARPASLITSRSFSFSEEQSSLSEVIPTRRILPEDIAQDSLQLFRISTNSFAVRWTYTKAGALKMLAFNEVHKGHKVRTTVGSFESPPCEEIFRPMPPTFTTYEQWKEAWLKRRTDKIYGVSEDDAKKIVEGLKSK